MSCESATKANPIEAFIGRFDTAGAAAEAAGVSPQMLRKMRARGYVTTRDRAIYMANACGNRISPAALMDLPKTGRAAKCV